VSWFNAVELRRWPSRPADQRDRDRQTRGTTQRGDPPARLNRGADRAYVRPEDLHGTVEVLDSQGQTPRARGASRSTPTLNDTVGLLDDLEDLGPEPKERLTWCSGRGRLLADRAQIQPGRLECPHAAIERGRERNDVIDRQHPVRMGGRGRRHRGLRADRRQPIELDTRDPAQRPAEDSPPGPTAGETHANLAELTAPSSNREAQRRPALRLIGKHQLVDRGRRGDLALRIVAGHRLQDDTPPTLAYRAPASRFR